MSTPPRWAWTSIQPLAEWKSIPGYPKERHEEVDVFVTRQVVMIVPAAPSCESTLTAAVVSLQSGSEAIDVLVDPLEVDAEAPPWPVVMDCCEPWPVGTGPASWAPFPPHPAATATTSAAPAKRILVMGSIVRAVRNPGWAPR